MDTLIEERDRIKKEKWNKKGTACRACEQYCRVYRRRFYRTLALDLISLYKLSIEQDRIFFNVKEIYARSRIAARAPVVIAVAAYWGLVIQQPKDPGDRSKRTSGNWAITDKGRDFVQRKIRIPSHAILFNKNVEGFSETTVQIDDHLGNFDYEELMRG